MARIRSIHPGIWRDKTFVRVSPLARLLYIGILNECDDKGAFKWEPIELKMNVLPVDNVDIEALLAELCTVDRIRMYEVAGQQYGAVRNFGKFQSPKKPNSVYPMPREFRIYACTTNQSTEPDEDEGSSGTEPDDDKGGGGSEIEPDQPASVLQSSEPERLVAASVLQKREFARQMEGRGEEGIGKEGRSSLRSPRARQRDPGHAFEQFWEAYPRKVGKGAARKAWIVATLKATENTIVSAVFQQKFDHRERFIPHPATWLNQERWLDEPSNFDPVLRAAGLDRPERDIDETPDWLRLPGGRA